MGKKQRAAIRPQDRVDEVDEDGTLDDEAAAEEAALRELEAEREAEEAELNELGGGGGGGSSSSSSSSNSKAIYNRSGLDAARAQIEERDLPWVERLDIVATEKLEIPDVHDDLQRELAFYEQTLAAVKEARERLKTQGVGWKRPDDFFCEMIKSDSHMAKVKDKLIFEQKKMEAFEQRKERQAQKKFSKARQADQVAEKSAAKKESIEALNKWRKDNKDRRKGALDDDEDAELQALMGGGDDDEDGGRGGGKNKKRKRDSGRDGSGPSKRREGLNKKYGFGGQKNKKATRNDGKGGGDVGFSTSSKAMKARSGAKTGKRPGKDTRNKNRQQQKGGKKRGPGR